MKKTGNTVDSIFVLVLFAVFAIAVLFVLMSGAGVYKDAKSVMTERFQERTCLAYITAKVNHYDEEGSVFVTEIDGVPALGLKEEMGALSFVTYIYGFDGSVREIMVEDGYDFSLSDGMVIVDADNLSFKQDGSLILVSCTGEGGRTASVILRTESGGTL